MSSHGSCNHENIHYRLYVCMLYFELIKLRQTMNVTLMCSHKKIYKHELEKYDTMKKLLIHCSALCDTKYSYNHHYYYDDIETILNTYIIESNSNHNVLKYPNCFKILFNKLNKINFSYTIIKTFEYSFFANGYYTNHNIKVLNKLAKIDYKYLFDIINIIQIPDEANEFNVFYVKVPNKFNANNITRIIDTILACFSKYDYYSQIRNKCCIYCKKIHMQIENLKYELEIHENPNKLIKSSIKIDKEEINKITLNLKNKITLYKNKINIHTHFVFFLKKHKLFFNGSNIIRDSFVNYPDIKPCIFAGMNIKYHEYNMEQLFL